MGRTACILGVPAFLVLTACTSTSDDAMTDPHSPPPAGSARLYRVILPVSDLDRAVRFYSQVLESPGTPVSGGRHYFDCGGTILACFDPRRDGDGYDPTPLPEWLYFAVADVEAAYERCRAAGARFEPDAVHDAPAGEVARRPWGEVSFYARDPFGNGICFVDRSTVFGG